MTCTISSSETTRSERASLPIPSVPRGRLQFTPHGERCGSGERTARGAPRVGRVPPRWQLVAGRGSDSLPLGATRLRATGVAAAQRWAMESILAADTGEVGAAGCTRAAGSAAEVGAAGHTRAADSTAAVDSAGAVDSTAEADFAAVDSMAAVDSTAAATDRDSRD